MKKYLKDAKKNMKYCFFIPYKETLLACDNRSNYYKFFAIYFFYRLRFHVQTNLTPSALEVTLGLHLLSSSINDEHCWWLPL